MKLKSVTIIFAALTLLLVAGFVALTLSASMGVASVAASSERKGDLHVTKDCSTEPYMGNVGDYCTITYSNLPEIKAGSKVFYDQAAGVPTGMLDSNVILDAGTGDWAVGRCTLDVTTGLGLCTFSDGTGQFTGFQARVDVTSYGPTNVHWDGTYSFSPLELERDR